MEISYRLRHPLALDIRLDVQGLTVLLGPSGVGKTSLLKALAGLLPAEGSPWHGLPPERRPVGWMPQHYALFPHLSALQNVCFPLAHLPRPQRVAQALELLERVHLAHLADRRPAELSGGEQQRVALARALARKPELLLLDEPTSALDASTRDVVLATLQDLVLSLGIPALVVTHDPAVAQVADRMAVLLDGRVAQQGTPTELFRHPSTLAIACAVGFRNLFAGTVTTVEADAAWLDTPAGRLRVTPQPWLRPAVRLHWGIRSEEVMLIRQDRPVSDRVGDNRLTGTISSLLHQGMFVRVGFAGPVPLEILLPRHIQDRLHLTVGETHEVALKPSYVQLFEDGGER
jgi:molybdate transport system ATP-binding protein